MNQNGLQEPQKPLKKPHVLIFCFAIWLFAPKIPKNGQDASQNDLKLVILRSKMAILGPSWRQVGQLSAILVPTWRQDAPQQTSEQSSRRILNRILGHLGARRFAQELQTPPGAQIFKDLIPFSSIVSSSCFKISRTSSRRWLCARSALDCISFKFPFFRVPLNEKQRFLIFIVFEM